jgi:hypothetical protein
VPLMVVAWSGLAYAIAKPSPGGLPRRVQMPNTWDVTTTWTVAGVRTPHISEVSGFYACISIEHESPSGRRFLMGVGSSTCGATAAA